MSAWPVGYREQLSGAACSVCAEGRPEEQEGRIRFFSSAFSDGYLHLRGVQRGYVVVIWRGRHMVEPTDLSEDEAAAFWFDMLRVSRAMQVVYRPLKMNYQLLGNRIAHLHWTVAPRFVDDVAPGDPLPGSGYHAFPEDEVRREVAHLRDVLAQMP
ncbi:MAG TPA: HIT domain-containing protein [Roseiflexaceae bacterium]|nr:HIT domain-containing protein [Roseiflexaceae bacterium]